MAARETGQSIRPCQHGADLALEARAACAAQVVADVTPAVVVGAVGIGTGRVGRCFGDRDGLPCHLRL